MTKEVTKTEIAKEMTKGTIEAIINNPVTNGIALVHFLPYCDKKYLDSSITSTFYTGLYYLYGGVIGFDRDVDFLKYSLAIPITTNVLSGLYRLSTAIPKKTRAWVKRAEERAVQKKLSLESTLAQSGALSEATEVSPSGALTYATQGGELSLLDRLRINSDASNPYLQKKQKQKQWIKPLRNY